MIETFLVIVWLCCFPLYIVGMIVSNKQYKNLIAAINNCENIIKENEKLTAENEQLKEKIKSFECEA